MLLILPHSAEVRHGKIPWVVAIIILLCIGIYIQQDKREQEIADALIPYCDNIYQEDLDEDSLDGFSANKKDCTSFLHFIHDLPDKDTFAELMHTWVKEDEIHNDKIYTKVEIQESINIAMEHYNEILPQLPPSIDSKLAYDPQVLNPFKSILSALSHGSWWHLIGNLIFFFAFATALEFIIANTFRFLLALIGIEFACDIAYSITVFLGADPMPTLGLSGIVFGVIGMSAYLMPNVRIRTFVWFFFYARNVYIPAVILAVWYIGWDTYYLVTSEWATGINIVAHVSAGFAGYFIARIFFKQRREETKDEVDDEIERMRSQRSDQLGVMSSYKSKSNHLTNALNADKGNRDYASWTSEIYKAINTNQDAIAINLLLLKYDEFRHATELYEEIYHEMLKWKHTRTILCLSRLLISEYIASRKYAKAIMVAQTAYGISDGFVFSDMREKTLLMSIAKKQGCYDLLKHEIK